MRVYLSSIIFLFLGTMFANTSLCQNQLTIRYESGPITSDKVKPKTWSKASILVYRDSVAYDFPIFGKHKKTKRPYGSKFLGHSIYINWRKKVMLTQSQPTNYPQFLIQDTLLKIEWTIEESEKIICGYKCRRAASVINDKVIVVYFAPELPHLVGPFSLNGLPGTILEVYWAGETLFTQAVIIENEAGEIIEPTNGKRVSKKEFNEIVAEMYRRKGL